MSPGEKLESTVQDRNSMLCSMEHNTHAVHIPAAGSSSVCSCESRLKLLLGGMKLID